LTHEGTKQVKYDKLDFLNRDYELFKMQPNESIKNLYNRLLDIINALLGLGKVFGKYELVRKLLGCLNDECEPNVTIIEESKDLKAMEIEELIGSLMTYEVKSNKKSIPQEEKKPQEERRRDLALKSNHKEENSSDEELEEEEDYVLFAKRFTKFAKMNKARRFLKKNPNKEEGS
ncbi:UBN2 domain-containing protein, partial [Cephalotus follicularis]